MKIQLDLDKKRITVTGDVNLQELLVKLMDLNIDTKEWTLTTGIEYVSPFLPSTPSNPFPLLGDSTNPYPTPYPMTPQVWY